MENGVSHLLHGGALPHHWSNGVQSPGAASRELPEAGHSRGKTQLPGHARMRKLFRAGGFSQGKRKHQHHIHNVNLFSSAGPVTTDSSLSFNF